MNGLYSEALHHLEKAFRILEGMVPPPGKVRHGDTFVFRYREQTILQALLQKLARVISGLHAAWLLVENGFFQEQGAVHRMLDEFHEDILFLAFAVINGDQREIHQRYLDAFYKEEFDHTTLDPSHDREMVPRKKIVPMLQRLSKVVRTQVPRWLSPVRSIARIQDLFTALPRTSWTWPKGIQHGFASTGWPERHCTKCTVMTYTMCSSAPSSPLQLWLRLLVTRNCSKLCASTTLSSTGCQDETMPIVPRPRTILDLTSLGEPRAILDPSPHRCGQTVAELSFPIGFDRFLPCL